MEVKDLSFAGELITDEKQAFDLAIGNLNISRKKLEKVTDYVPETAPIIKNPSYGKRAIHPSIWKKEGYQVLQAEENLEANKSIQECRSEVLISKDASSNCIGIERNTKKNYN